MYLCSFVFIQVRIPNLSKKKIRLHIKNSGLPLQPYMHITHKPIGHSQSEVGSRAIEIVPLL